MEALYFMLGAFAVVAILAIVSVFRIKKDVMEQVEDRLYDTKDDIVEIIDKVESNTEKEIENLEKDLRFVESELAGDLKELTKSVDSRVDKLNARLEDIIARQVADLYSYIDAKFNDNTAFTDLLHHKIEDLENKNK